MPAIYLFQRRTLYGGDDLHLLALVTAAVRVCQLLCFGVLVYHIVHNVQYNMDMDMAAAAAAAASSTSVNSASVSRASSSVSSKTTSTTASVASATDSRFGVAWNPHDHPLAEYRQFDVQDERSSGRNTLPPFSFEEEKTFEPSLPPEKDDDDAAVAPLPDYNYERRRLLQQDKTTTSTASSNNSNNNLGLFLLEYFWMDAAHNSLLNGGGDLDKAASCSNSHLYPLLLMSFPAAGLVFGVGSIVMLWHIYQTSSMGCPTMERHPRTEKMEQLLEWLFFPMNILHFLIFILGISAMMMAYTYLPCDSYSSSSSPSTFFTILWILCAILILISQAIEIFWNFGYVVTLFYHNPHALVWTPNNTSQSTLLTSYHSSGSLTNPMISSADARQQQQYPSEEELQHMNHELVEQMWADRCSNFCRCLGMGTCYVFGGRELYGSGIMQYGDFARAVADYLETRGVLDVVPSDIIVGFLVLQQLQTQRRHRQRREVLVEHSKLSLYSTTNTTTSFSTLEPDSTRSVTPFGSSQQPQLHNHRANANGNTPNGMQLQPRSPLPTPTAATTTDVLSSTDALFQSPAPQPYQQSSSSESLVPTSNRSNGATSSSRSVLLQSIGTGTVLLADSDQSMEVANGNLLGIHSPHHHNNIINGGDNVTIDQSTPPPRPQSFSSLSAVKNKSNHGIHAGNSVIQESQESSYQQQQEPNRFRGFQRVLSEHNHADVLALEEGARYSKYALAIYTWYLYLYVNPVTGIPKLCTKAWNTKNCSCCFSGGQHNNSSNNNNGSGNGMTSSNSSPTLHQSPSASNTSPRSNSGGGANIHYNRTRRHRWEGDNICQAHKNALLLTAGLENEADLVYVQLKSSFNHNPYCILLDHETQAVIVAVRGTFSLEDCVTDVLIEAECLEALGDEFGFGDIAKGQHVHGGVLACARNVYRDLKRHGSLEYLLETKYPHYQLRLVGHSLGAACSTMLGFMLRQTYPNLQCYNYSPPGCTLTWDMAIQCQPWCTSFVLDTEVVPRLSFESLENLRDEVLDLIGRIRVPKVEVARRVATKTLWCDGKKSSSSLDAATRQDMDIVQACASVDAIDELLDDILLPVDEMPPADSTSYREQLEQFQTVQSERRAARGTRRAIRLFPPGRILHLVKTDQEQSCRVQIAKCLTCCTTNAGAQYHPVWIGNGDLNEIVVSPTMGTDHFPNRMVDELHGILQHYGLGEAPMR